MEHISKSMERCLSGASSQPEAPQPPPAEDVADMTFYNQPPEPPLHVFPQEIRQLLKQAATAFKHAPVEVPLVGFLSLLSGCIGRSRTVEVKGSWQESGNLYLVLVGDSGILLNSSPNSFSKEPRPVYASELNLLGFDKHWRYNKQNDRPYMWAEANNYYYRGTLVSCPFNRLNKQLLWYNRNYGTTSGTICIRRRRP